MQESTVQIDEVGTSHLIWPFVTKMVLTVLYLCWLCSILKVKEDDYFQGEKKGGREKVWTQCLMSNF